MIPLTPEERAAILAANPNATEADLDALEALVSLHFTIEPPPEIELTRSVMEGESEQVKAARQKLAEIEAQITEMQARLFPNYEQALADLPRRQQSGKGIA